MLASYRRKVFRFLTLILLVSALIVPRAAWGAHLSGHDDLSTAGAVHAHHDDDSHEHETGKFLVGDPSIDTDSEGEQDGLTHDHSPSFAVSAAIVLPDDAILPALNVVAASTESMERSGTSLSHPDSLLRPPRAI
jgi:hypothetical protein